ncbi:hypothetical protein Tco_0094998, partial [Tanacetum coccineum]
CKEKIKNDKSFKENQSKEFLKEREQYFEIQDLKAQLQDKGIAIMLADHSLRAIEWEIESCLTTVKGRCKHISCNPVQHFRTKHIDVRYHFIKKQFEKGIVELFFVGTEYQLADLFTKALSEDRFKYLVRRLGMRCLTPDELEVLANESA